MAGVRVAPQTYSVARSATARGSAASCAAVSAGKRCARTFFSAARSRAANAMFDLATGAA